MTKQHEHIRYTFPRLCTKSENPDGAKHGQREGSIRLGSFISFSPTFRLGISGDSATGNHFNGFSQ